MNLCSVHRPAGKHIIMEKALSNFPQFDVSDDFIIFKERFENQLEVYGIDNDARSGILISSLSANVYKMLKSLCDPALPKNKGYDELVKLLLSLFTVKISLLKERKRFYDARQYKTETANNWFLRVKNLSVNCAFGDELEFCLKDRFVCGLQPGPVFDQIAEQEPSACELALDNLVQLVVSRDELMRQNHPVLPPLPPSQPGSKAARKKKNKAENTKGANAAAAGNNQLDPMFVEEAVKHVLQDFAAKKQTAPKPKGPKPFNRPMGGPPKQFHQSSESLSSGGRQFNEAKPPSVPQASETKTCWHCGMGNHDFMNCRFKNFTCYNCEQVGHVVTMCKHPLRK